jgi:hypothetical protein
MAHLVKLKGSLKDHVNLNTVKNNIVTYIQSIPNYQTLKNDVELYELIFTRLKNELKQSSGPIDYSTVVLDILTIVFSLTDLEKTAIFKVLQYLDFNGLVKKAGVLKKAQVSVVNYLKGK